MARRWAGGPRRSRHTGTAPLSGRSHSTLRMVDCGQDIDVSRLFDGPPDAVFVTHAEALPFYLRLDPVLLKLRADEMPDAVRWPSLSGIEVHAVTDGMVPAVAARLVAVLLDAGARVVYEFDVTLKTPIRVRSHVGASS